MMRGGYFDDEGTVHTMGVPGEMLVSMVFSDEADEDTEQTKWFNKRERFYDHVNGYTMWDQVTNFGFHTLPDGRLEVYHHGEYFTGYLPGVSLVMKCLFQFQAFWVAYATEYHLNNLAFKSKTDHDEEMEELSRRNFWWFMARYEVVRAVKERLGLAAPKVVDAETDEDEDEDEDEDKEESTEEGTVEEEEKEDAADDVVDTSQVINVKRR